MRILRVLLCLKILIAYSKHVFSERLKDQITVQLDSGVHNCFTLLNGTHQVGCQSNVNGNSGTLILINHADELENSYSNQLGDVIVTINIEYLTHSLIDSVILSDNIKGVILFRNHTDLLQTKHSEDASCPNQDFSFYTTQNNSCSWNSEGAVHPSGIRFLNWKKPVFLITNETEVDLIVNKCIKAFNYDSSSNNNPKCMAKMFMRMHAAGDAQVCLRRQQLFSGLSDSIDLCDPLGDENVFALVPPISKNDQPNIFMLTTRLDTLSMFTNNDGGDISVLTSLITSLVVVHTIGRQIVDFQEQAKANNKQIMFGFFHGESLGYIGSSRMVYDMNSEKFPVEQKNFSAEKSAHSIQLKHIEMYVELQHVSFEADLTDYFVHVDQRVYSKFKSDIDKAISFSAKGMEKIDFKLLKSSTTMVPPASYYTLLKNESVPGFIISSFNQSYRYKNINSLLDLTLRHDNKRKLRASVIKHIKATASSSLYAILNHVFRTDPAQEKDYKIDQSYIEKLVDCFFYSENWSCSFFNEILNITQKADFTKTLYIGTKKEQSFIRILVHALLIHSLGNKTFALNVSNSAQCKSHNDGQNLYSFNWQFDPITNKSYCYRTSVYRTPAISPAFEIDDYDFSSGVYSTWVESVWEPRRLELYISTGYTTDLIVFLIGIIFFVLSVLTCKKLNIEAWLDDPVLLPNRPEPL